MNAALLVLLLAVNGERPFSIDELLAIPRVTDPQLSPDGRWVAFTIGRQDREQNRSTAGLYLVPVTGGEPKALAQGPNERVGSARFSPDGKRIAFISNRSGASQVHVVDTAGGEPRQVTQLVTDASAVFWSSDGRHLHMLVEVDPACGADAACTKKATEARKGRPHLSDELLYRHWNVYRGGARTHLLRIPVEGGTPVDLTPGNRDVPPFHRGEPEDLAASPDGTELYFAAVSDPMEAISTNADIYAVPVAGGAPRKLTNGKGWDGTPRPSPDGKMLAWRSQPRAGYESDRLHLMVATRTGTEPRDLTATFDASVDQIFWSPDGKRIRFTADGAGRRGVYEVKVDGGTIRKIYDGANIVTATQSADGRVMVAAVDSMTRPAEIALLEMGEPGRTAKILTQVTRQAMAGLAMGEPRPLRVKAKDGQIIHGWLLTPPGHKRGERHPMVVLIHGGPQSAWRDSFGYRWNPMLYAARGWTVVLPNPRGSTGFGQAYADAVRANWGGTPYQDIMTITDAAVESGEGDAERACAAGASYGGYMVNWINGHTNRFRCLVNHAGILNLESAYFETEELWFPEWEMGLPWEDRPIYERWTPHKHVSKWKTPTLVSHGELDYRVVVTQGIGTFTALQRKGIRSRILLFPDEGHWILKPRNAKAFHDTVLGWISEHIDDQKTKKTAGVPGE
jgi:dipeptidyl aminopeptidase/acylaminoacyl peptidase